MKEVYLYRCIICGNVRCEEYDRGDRFYLDQCVGCKDWSDYEKIVIAQGSNGYKESQCYVQEKSDDTEEERKVDVDRSVDK